MADLTSGAGDQQPEKEVKPTPSLQRCSRCRKMLILCTCATVSVSNGGRRFGLNVVFETGWDGDDLLPGDVLDIVNCEIQPGNDLDTAAPLCEKNHQHDDFVPVGDLSTNSLPEDIRDPTVYVWLRSCCPLVVRLLHNDRRATATGQAHILASELGKTVPCDQLHCPFLSSLGRDHNLYGGIGITTNNHVVANDDEASTTLVEFFYNDDDRQRPVFKELAHRLHLTNRRIDFSIFSCYVHSTDLIDLVDNLNKLRDYSWQQIPETIRMASKAYAIIISHPHGVSKQVSFGRVVDRKIECQQGIDNFNFIRSLYQVCERSNSALQRFAAYASVYPDLPFPFTKTWYTTATCMGSSGAPVYMGNTEDVNGEEINQAHTHRGVDRIRGYNYCFSNVFCKSKLQI